MAKFLDSLTADQKKNVLALIACMQKDGITNTMMQAGILAVISKESTFVPKSEKDYSRTGNARIRSVFGSRLKDLDEDQLTALKKDPKAFFDLIYGGRYGNAPDEGYKYRGRGYNQLTFKSNYEKTAARINVDVVNFPDKLNEVAIATEAVISFFREKIELAPKAKLALYNLSNINDAKSLDDAVNAAYHANTGWGKTRDQIVHEKTGGYAKALSRVAEFYEVTSGKLSLQNGGRQIGDGVSIQPDSIPVQIPHRKVRVNTRTLNIRIKPDVESPKIKDRNPAKMNEEFIVYAEKNGWYKISATRDWWISGKYCVVQS